MTGTRRAPHPAAPPDVLTVFPDRPAPDFPAEFPDFPDDAALVSRCLVDHPWEGADDDGSVEERGTQIVKQQHAVITSATDEAWDRVVAFYRSSLPEQGWVVDSEHAPVDSHCLFFLSEPTRANVDLHRESERIVITHVVNTYHSHLLPYADFGPHIPLPRWYADAAPEPPERAVRVATRLIDTATARSVKAPVLLQVLYRLEGNPSEDDFDPTLAQVRDNVGSAGWSLVEEADGSISREGSGQRRVELTYRGYGSLLRASVSQNAYECRSTPPVMITLEYQADSAASTGEG